MSTFHKFSVVTVLLLFMVGCGGGGGGSPNLSFSTGPVSTGALAAMPAIEVQILDAAGNLDTSATDVVTLSLGAVQPEILIHQSGNGPYVLETVDLVTFDQLGWFESQPGEEIGGMAYDANTGTLLYSISSANNFLSLDPSTDSQTLIGAGTTDDMKGIAFESGGANRLLAVPSSNTSLNVDSLYSIEPSTGVTTEIGTIVPDAGTILGFNGLATNPVTGTLYAATKFNPVRGAPRGLTTINPSTLALTTIGPLNEAGGNNVVANLAFAADGTLYAITGDAQNSISTVDNPESLFTVNKATGELTLLASLDIIQGNTDGEAIGIIPAPLMGTVSVAAVGGVATFNDLKLNASATGYTLVASAAGFSDVTSGAFDITPITGTVGSVQFAIAAQAVGEAVGNVTVTVDIDNAQTHDVIVAMSVAGTATGAAGIDPDHDIDINNFFNITIPAGDIIASRTFAVIDDVIVDAAETVVLTIENASLAVIGVTSVHTVTINDND